MNKVMNSSEQISGVIYDWLWAEYITSGEGRNRYLDANSMDPAKAQEKFDDIRTRIALPYDNDNNWLAQKDTSHQNRLPGWIQSYELNPVGDDGAEFLSARLMFAPLMSVSGAYRAQCYLEASSPTDYTFRRSALIGIDLEKTIDARLREQLPPRVRQLDKATLTIEGLKRSLDDSYGVGETQYREMFGRHGLIMEAGNEDTESVENMKKAQYSWVRVATDCVIMAAKLRKGELEAVPFMEPVSISDQSGSIYYPLRKRVNWLEALAA